MEIAIIISLIILIAGPVLVAKAIIESKKRFVQRELSDIISKCTAIESSMTRGFARFEPPSEERYLYDILVKAGVMRINPVGGYSLTTSTSKALDMVDGKEIVDPSISGEKDDVLVSGVSKEGKIIPLIIEKDGKPINASTGEIITPKNSGGA